VRCECKPEHAVIEYREKVGRGRGRTATGGLTGPGRRCSGWNTAQVTVFQAGRSRAWHICEYDGPAGDLVGVTRQVVNWPLTDRTSAFGRVPGNRHDRVRVEARELSNKQIASRLTISAKTASSHVEHIYTKIGVSNRAIASLYAANQGGIKFFAQAQVVLAVASGVRGPRK
jgi:Bacterial regulatory proteins, luxR family